jgi:glutamate synthase (NADPH/NADH) small chain
MAETPMLSFVRLGQEYPHKREAAERAADFAEIADRFAVRDAEAQSSRCSQCGVPYCTTHCPLHNHIPDWLRLTAEGRLREAYELSNATSTMPEICGRICPQDRLCEGNCVIEFSGHGAVTIGSVEKFITDTAWDQGWVEPVRVGTPRGQSIGVIGAGPAGLTAAELMRTRGYDVHVYDRHDRAGGLLTYGIPGFKLEKPVVMRRVERLRRERHRLPSLGSRWAATPRSKELRGRHDALLIATGVYRPRAIKAPGCRRGRDRRGARLSDRIEPQGVWRCGAELRRRQPGCGGQGRGGDRRRRHRDGLRAHRDPAACPIGEVPLSPGPRQHAGVAARGEECRGGRRRVRLAFGPGGLRRRRPRDRACRDPHAARAQADVSGRRAPEPDPAGGFRVQADLVIKALGFDAEDLPTLFGARDLSVTRWGTLRIDHTSMQTSLDGVFAAGDIVRGASLVVWAIRDGRDVADKMHAYCRAKAKAGSAREKVAA